MQIAVLFPMFALKWKTEYLCFRAIDSRQPRDLNDLCGPSVTMLETQPLCAMSVRPRVSILLNLKRAGFTDSIPDQGRKPPHRSNGGDRNGGPNG